MLMQISTTAWKELLKSLKLFSTYSYIHLDLNADSGIVFFRWASIKLGINMPARVERAIRIMDGESQVMEPTGEFYDVIMFFGIIDILQDYDISKKLEHAYKSMQYDATSISAVDPKLYSKRFRDFIFKIFVEDD